MNIGRFFRVLIALLVLLSIVYLILLCNWISFLTITSLVVLCLLFVFTKIPYFCIASIFRILPPTGKSCSIVLPFLVNKVSDLNAILTVPYGATVTSWRQTHELTHVLQVKRLIEKYGEKGRIVFCILQLSYIVWYSYPLSPFEIEANEVANKKFSIVK